MALTLTTDYTCKAQQYVQDWKDDDSSFDVQYEGSRHD